MSYKTCPKCGGANPEGVNDDERVCSCVELMVSDQIRAEIHAVIDRYSKESDVTTYQVIGALEVVKMDLMEELGTFTKK